MTESAAAQITGVAAPERVAETLRDRIVEGELRPGAPLREVALAEELGVSRNTLREAVRLLTTEELVEVKRHRGAVVKMITVEEVRDIYLVRRTVELRAIDDSALATERTMAGLERACAAAEEAAVAGSWREVGTASLRFHQALVATLGSPRLDALFRTTVAQMRLAFAAIADEADFQRSFVPRDREICDLLAAGSRAAAAAALRRYLDDAERAVIEVLRLHAVPYPS
ncbi:GntR family transcriptional regulator [Amycolatopsis sp. NPDC051903]|uniref:GntR family transcriptional regulator n=1 Tax=Amycolatopsis sp. NPDC051903 TaxID=3363936 RepID=UPI0037B34F16